VRRLFVLFAVLILGTALYYVSPGAPLG